MTPGVTAALQDRGEPFADLAGVHVLVVDDEDGVRDVYRDVLVYCGAVVSCAASALEALRAIQSVLPRVVVTDLQMPGHSGEWLLHRLREQGHRIPVLLVTASLKFNRDLARRAGFDDYLEKPMGLTEFCEAVARLARQRGADVHRAS